MRPESGTRIQPREKSDSKSVKKGGLYLKFQGMNFIIKLIIALKWVKVGNWTPELRQKCPAVPKNVQEVGKGCSSGGTTMRWMPKIA